MRGTIVTAKRTLAYELFSQGKTTDEVMKIVHCCQKTSHQYYNDWCVKRTLEKQEVMKKQKKRRYCASGVIFCKCSHSFWLES